MIIDQVDIGLDAGSVEGDDAGQTVAGLVGRAVSAQSAHTEWQQQPTGAGVLDSGMGSNGLEAGVQQCRVHAVGALLAADRGGQADLSQHRVAATVGGVDRVQRGEGRPELNTASVEPVPDVGTISAMRMAGEQCVHVVGGGHRIGITVHRLQNRTGPAVALTVLVGLNKELQRARPQRARF